MLLKETVAEGGGCWLMEISKAKQKGFFLGGGVRLKIREKGGSLLWTQAEQGFEAPDVRSPVL